MKKYLSLVLIVVIAVAIALLFSSKKAVAPSTTESKPAPVSTGKIASPLDISYVVDDEIIKLKDGKSVEEAAPGSAAEITTEVFGEPVYGDMGFGKDTSVMFLVQETAGTGIFFYTVAAHREGGTPEGGSYKGSKAFFLGDRITPQTIKIVNGVAEVTYMTRKEKEAMSEEPTVIVKKYLIFKDGELVEKGK